MVRLTLTRSVLLSVILLETMYLMMSLQRLADLEEHCAADEGMHVEGHDIKKKGLSLISWLIIYKGTNYM